MAQQQGQQTSFFGNIFKKIMAAKRAQQQSQAAPQVAQQGTQQFGAAMPFQTGGGSFFRRRGV
jgi:hypothetical protein